MAALLRDAGKLSSVWGEKGSDSKIATGVSVAAMCCSSKIPHGDHCSKYEILNV